MTVLDQVLQAEQESNGAVTAAREAAKQQIAAAEQTKQSTIVAAKEAASEMVLIAKQTAEQQAEKEATEILAAADSEAVAAKKAILDNKDALTTRVVEAFNKNA